MATRMYLFGLLCFAILGSSSRTFRTPVIDSAAWPAAELRQVYLSEVGIKEATGRNDGPRIAEYLRYCGLPEGYEWCAAFVSWVYGQAGYAQPRNAWAAALFPAARLVRSTPQQGDIFGLYSPAKRRIGHCGFIDSWNGKWCITVEGNMDNAVVQKRRLASTIKAVARWTDSRHQQQHE